MIILLAAAAVAGIVGYSAATTETVDGYSLKRVEDVRFNTIYLGPFRCTAAISSSSDFKTALLTNLQKPVKIDFDLTNFAIDNAIAQCKLREIGRMRVQEGEFAAENRDEAVIAFANDAIVADVYAALRGIQRGLSKEALSNIRDQRFVSPLALGMLKADFVVTHVALAKIVDDLDAITQSIAGIGQDELFKKAVEIGEKSAFSRETIQAFYRDVREADNAWAENRQSPQAAMIYRLIEFRQQ